MLAAVLGTDRVGADPDAAADVAALCACLPLALRIAAAHLTRHARQPLGGLAAELREGNRLSVLSVAGDEQSAVRASFDLSYAGLRPAARRMFLLAGLSPGGDLSTRAAAALAAVPAEAAREVLADLTEAHLMDEDVPGRFGMHDLLRLYAGDRARAELGAPEREAAIRTAVRLLPAGDDRRRTGALPQHAAAAAAGTARGPRSRRGGRGRGRRVRRARGRSRLAGDGAGQPGDHRHLGRRARAAGGRVADRGRDARVLLDAQVRGGLAGRGGGRARQRRTGQRAATTASRGRWRRRTSRWRRPSAG